MEAQQEVPQEVVEQLENLAVEPGGQRAADQEKVPGPSEGDGEAQALQPLATEPRRSPPPASPGAPGIPAPAPPGAPGVPAPASPGAPSSPGVAAPAVPVPPAPAVAVPAAAAPSSDSDRWVQPRYSPRVALFPPRLRAAAWAAVAERRRARCDCPPPPPAPMFHPLEFDPSHHRLIFGYILLGVC